MTRSTQWWVGVGLVLAALFFAGAVAIMWITDDTINQDNGTPRDTPADSIMQEEMDRGEFIQILWLPVRVGGMRD